MGSRHYYIFIAVHFCAARDKGYLRDRLGGRCRNSRDVAANSQSGDFLRKRALSRREKSRISSPRYGHLFTIISHNFRDNGEEQHLGFLVSRANNIFRLSSGASDVKPELRAGCVQNLGRLSVHRARLSVEFKWKACLNFNSPRLCLGALQKGQLNHRRA